MAAQREMHEFDNAKRVLTSLGLDLVDNYAQLMKAVVVYSVHPTAEDAIAELSRSELIFLALLEAMSLRQLEMSSSLLKLVDKFIVFPRITKSFGGKLDCEFNVPSELLAKAWSYAKELKDSGLLEVPDLLLKFIDHLRKCTEKAEKAAAKNLTTSTTAEDACGIDGVPAEPTTKERRRRRRRRSPQDRQQPQEAEVVDIRDVAAGPDLPAPVASVETQTSRPASPVPPPQVVRSAEEVRVATTELWTAVDAGDAAGARTALGRGANVASRRSEGGARDWTPLHEAAFLGNTEVTEVLLAAGAELEARDGWGVTPLKVAAQGWKEEVVRRLLEAGAQPDAAGNDGWTALHTAANKCYLSIVQLLVQAGADVNRRTNDGMTPLSLAQAGVKFIFDRPIADYLRSFGATQ